MAEQIMKKSNEGNFKRDDITMNMELESYILDTKEKALNNHFTWLMTELLKWEKNAPEVEISKSR